MFLVIPEASDAFKLMFFDALEIQEPSWIDPGSIWEKSFFHENFQNFETQNFIFAQTSHPLKLRGRKYLQKNRFNVFYPLVTSELVTVS